MKIKRWQIILSVTIFACGTLLFVSYFYHAETAEITKATTTPKIIPVKIHKPVFVNILASFDAFTPHIIRAQVGQEIHARILANGNHTFTIDEFKVDRKINNGETVTVTFTPDRAGSFKFYSRLAEDKKRNVSGVLVVSE